MHPAVRTHVARSLADWLATVPHDRGRTPDVLEVGARDVNGGVRDLLPPLATYHGLDIAPGPGVDTVADAADWQPERTYDVVLCLEVLEHAERWAKIVANLAAWTAPGGVLIVTCATHGRAPHSGLDGGPVRDGEHYGNVGAAEVAELLPGCTLTVDPQAGDLYATWRRT